MMMRDDLSAAIRHSSEKKRVGIWDLLVWAFQRECARIEFDDYHADEPACVGVEYRLMHQGCRVDGGGRSLPHHDADLIGSALAVLPEECGGQPMAIWIADLARAGQHPDWMEGAVPRCHPVDIHTNRHGLHAKTANSATLFSEGWPPIARRNKKGAIVHDEVKFCPVVFAPTGAQIARARRAYLDWYSALMHLRSQFQILRDLTSFTVDDTMPPMTPWKKTVDEVLAPLQ